MVVAAGLRQHKTQRAKAVSAVGNCKATAGGVITCAEVQA